VRKLVPGLALVVAMSAPGSSAAETTSSISFHRQVGSPIAFPGTVRAWCERDALYVVTLGRTNQSRWRLSVARKALVPRRTVAFTWKQARGITLFVFDARTRNEASESAEGSRGHVVLRRATCKRGGALEIAVSALIASEFSDGSRIRTSGVLTAKIGARRTPEG
jgi:hypothetical protein